MQSGSGNGSSRPSFISTFQNMFVSSSVASKLYALRKGRETDEWAEKAIDVVVKKLKRTNGALTNLLFALNNPGAPSQCVTITKNLDGRMQIVGKKANPHVFFCRLWRWPDLKSHHELQGTRDCAYSFSTRHQDLVCINPYHYVRMVAPILPPIEIPSTPQQFYPGVSPLATPLPPASPVQSGGSVTSTQRAQQQQQFYQTQFLPGGDFGQMDVANHTPQNALATELARQVDFDYQSPSPQSNSSQGYHSASPSFSPDYQQQQQPHHHHHHHQEYKLSQFEYPQYAAPAQPSAHVVPYVEQAHWAEIAYYEFNRRVGEKFYCGPEVITVDGYTDPSNDLGRFCLGRLLSPHRTEMVEKTRQCIGRGIQLTYVNKEVWLENLMMTDEPADPNKERTVSGLSVFVQSSNSNIDSRRHPITVVKLLPGQCMKIFDSRLFRELLDQCAKSGFEDAYALTNMCTIRLSLIKGWGVDYHRRDVTATPCWIEIQLNGPLKWLDDVLTTMGSARFAISSVS